MDKTKTAVSLRVCTAAWLALLRELCNDDPGGPRSSVAGGDRHRNLVKLGEDILRQVEVGRRGILLQTSHLLRAGDGNHMLPLRQGPGYGDLRRRGPSRSATALTVSTMRLLLSIASLVKRGLRARKSFSSKPSREESAPVR